MNSKSIVLTALLLSSGSALAQTQLPSVQVRPQAYPNDEAAMSFACGDLYEPSRSDVESLLQIKDPMQTHRLTLKLMGAVVEACNAGVPLIVVERSKQGSSLTWRPARSYEAGVALY